MDKINLSPQLSVSGQITASDISDLAEQGIKTIFCNRPDGEGADQPGYQSLAEVAQQKGLQFHYLPVVSGKITDQEVAQFAALYAEVPQPIHAYCRSGMRSTILWALSQVQIGSAEPKAVFAVAKKAGFDLTALSGRLVTVQSAAQRDMLKKKSWDVLIVGGGAAGIAVAASLLARQSGLSLAIIEPSEVHYYQPGWTLVGAGVFEPQETKRTTASLIPAGVTWIKAAVAAFEPERNVVIVEGCEALNYKRLVVAAGLMLDWQAVEGLPETLGKNGVTSNYRFDLAPYTWELVQQLKQGRALFTQPPMPIKCAGAPQKAMYLSGDYWHRQQCLKNIQIEFFTPGAVLFGVPEYVPALMEYINKYHAQLNFLHNLLRVDGPKKTAWFQKTDAQGNKELVETSFDLLHVCPPQKAPNFIRASGLADQVGWVDVDQNTLQHKRYANIWSLGDVMNAPNAKTAAAARKQAPVVAENILADLKGRGAVAHYDGYGSCPLTVERGKVVLAEFGYGGKLLPSFPRWLLDGTQPTRLAWLLKEKLLPPIYWEAMLKGHEWLAKPKLKQNV